MVTSQTIYASVDLELSGFEPGVDEIIEVGIVRFVVSGGMPTILDSWESLVRPTGDIRGRVLGLTGISTEDLNSAPVWSAVKPLVERLLEDAVIVGHGVELDCKFLEAQGVKLTGLVIDTLELAQIFLPSYQAYNLENLAFGLGATHTAAHRALADAEATYGILIKFIGIYRALPLATQTVISEVSRARKLLWHELFLFSTEVMPYTLEGKVLAKPAKDLLLSPDSKVKTEILQGSVTQEFFLALDELRTHIPPWVVAYGEREKVFQLSAMFQTDAYLGAFEALSRRAVEDLLDRVTELSTKEALALLKVLVWQSQGSPHGILAEMNWSIVGTELKRLFTSGFSARTPTSLVLTDFRSLADFRDSRNIWIDQLDSLATHIEQKSGILFSWHALLSVLRQTYNPETGYGNTSRKEEVLSALAATDVFFARVLLLFRSELHVSSGVMSPEDCGPYVWNRIAQAAENLSHKLATFLRNGEDSGLTKTMQVMDRFFAPNEKSGFVRWIEFSDDRCVFVLRPTSLAQGFADITRVGASVHIYSDLKSSRLLQYLTERLGVPEAKLSVPKVDSIRNTTKKRLIIVDGFEKEVLAACSSEKSVMVVFPSVPSLKHFYDEHWTKTSPSSNIVAVGIHGGVQKVLRNFEHNTKSIVLAPGPSLAAYAGPRMTFSRVLFAGLPYIDRLHPLYRRLAVEYFTDSGEMETNMQILAIAQALRVFDFSFMSTLDLLANIKEESQASFVLKEIF